MKCVKFVESVGRSGAFDPKCFNVFNISPVLCTFPKKHLTFPLFREGKRRKDNISCFREDQKTPRQLAEVAALS